MRSDKRVCAAYFNKQKNENFTKKNIRAIFIDRNFSQRLDDYCFGTGD